MWNLKNNNETPHFATFFFHTFWMVYWKIMSSLSCCDKHIYRGVQYSWEFGVLFIASGQSNIQQRQQQKNAQFKPMPL